MTALRARLQPFRPHLPAAVGLAALVVFLFRHAVLGGQVFYRRDLHLQWQAQVLAFVRAVAEGSWPVWNPWAGFGQPLWANPNNQVLYPFTWLHLVLQPWTYYTCFVVAHFLFSALGMYALGMRLGLSRGGSMVAAAVWVASGPLLSLVDLWNHLSAAAWLPWIFLAADHALASGSLSAALVCGAALAMPVLSGSPETALMAGLAVAGHGLWSRARRPPPHGSARRIATTTAVALAFAAALSTAQWWPSLELIRGSPRLTPSGTAGRTFWSVHPLVALQAFLPVFPDRLPLRSEVRAAYSESREAFLPSIYLGISSLGLVLAGADRSRRRLWMFFFLLATVGVLLALGRHTPVYGSVSSLVPLLKALRFPAKALILTSFAWAILAGLGFEAWREGTAGRAAGWTAAAALGLAAAIAGGLSFVLRTHAEEWGSAILFRATSPRSYTEILAPTARGLAVASGLALAMLVLVSVRRLRAVPSARLASAAGVVVLADLLSVHHRLDATAARELLTYRPPALAAIRPRPFMRTYVYDYFDAGKAPQYLGHLSAYLTARPQEDWPVPWLDALALRTALYPSVLGVWKVEGAYDLDRLDLYPLPAGMLTRALRQLEGTPFHLRLLRLGAVEYVVALHRQGFEDLAPVATLPSLFVEPLFVFRVPEALPRTYAVGAARRAETPLDELRVLVEPAFDPSHEIVLPEGAAAPAAASFSGRSRIVEFRADRVRLESELNAPGFVVLVDAHDAGWRATVDGRPAEVLRANVAFRAVAVPAGRHAVEYLYRPRSITWGLAVSGAALLAAVGVMSVEARRRRSAREAA